MKDLNDPDAPLLCDSCGEEVDDTEFWEADDGEISCVECMQLKLFEELDENGNKLN